MDKKKIIATIAAISLSAGVVGFATACGDGTENEPPHEHTYSTEWTSKGGDTHWHESTCEHKGLKDKEEKHVDTDGDKFCDKCEQDLRATVAITVATVTGGTVTLDKTAPKEGETVTVTVAASEGYTFKSVKLGEEVKTLDANGKFTFTATAAVTITAEFEAKTITLDASTVNAEHGAVAFKFLNDKTEYKYGETVILHVTEKGYFKLDSLYINGDTSVNYADTISDDGDILLTECKKEALTITADFVLGYRDITVTVNGKRMGSTVALTAADAVTVGGYDNITVADGTVSLTKAEIGKAYTVGAKGYNNASFTVGAETAYTAELQWKVSDCYVANETNRDISHFNDANGYVTAKNDSSDMFLYTEKFIGADAIFTAKFKTANFAGQDNHRSYLGFMFGEKINVSGATWFGEQIAVHLIDDANRRAEWMGGALHNAASLCKEENGGEKWNAPDRFNTKLPQSVIDKWTGDEGVELTIVRHNGTDIYMFVDGLYIDKYVLPAKYASELAAPVIAAPGTKKGQTIPFTLTEGAAAVNKYLTATAAISNDSVLDGVTVTPNKATGAFLDDVELTVTVPAGKKLTSLLVDGNDILSELTFKEVGAENAEVYTYGFKMRNNGNKDVNVKIETEAVVLADLDVTVKGKKLGVTSVIPQNTTVTFKGSRYTFTVDANGKIAQQNIAAGTYTVHVDGYVDQQITISKDTPLTEIVLEYDLFRVVRYDTEGHVLTHVNEERSYIEWTGTKTSLNVVSKEKFLDDATISVTLKSSFCNSGSKEQGIILQFEDGKAAILNINVDGTPRLQFRPELFSEKNDETIGLHSAFGTGWVEFRNVTDDEVENYNSEETGIVLKLVRNGNKLISYIDGVYKGTAELPESYTNSKMGFGLFAFGAQAGSKWYYTVEENAAVTVTNNTTQTDVETNNGYITVATEGIKLGDTVTVTATINNGYILDTLTVVGGTEAVRTTEGNYKFIATSTECSVTATFKEGVEFDAIVLKAVGINNSEIDLNDKTLIFTPVDGGTASPFVVRDGKISVQLAKGRYKVSVDETATPFGNTPISLYYDIEVTVGDTGFVFENGEQGLSFTRKYFTYNLINEGNINENSAPSEVDNSAFAAEGKITSTKACTMYEWTVDKYTDVAITITAKSGHGEQGLVAMFEDTDKTAVKARIQNNKVQFIGGGWPWDMGTQRAVDKWDFGSGENYANDMKGTLLTKYNGTGLDLTLMRRGAFIYILIDGEVYAAQNIGEFASKKINLAIWATAAKAGYEMPVKIETDPAKLDKMLTDSANSNGVLSVLGKFTVTENTLAVTGDGYAEFAPTTVTTKESLAVTLKSENSNATKKAQGILYRFTNGQWVAIRIESSSAETYIQFADDALIPKRGGCLNTSWAKLGNRNFTAAEKTAYDSEFGIELKLVRDGKTFSVYLGGALLQTFEFGEEYATMDGVIAATVENGAGKAFGYDYKSGEDVIISEGHNVTVSAVDNTDDQSRQCYNVGANKTVVEDGGSVTLFVTTVGNWWQAWSYFPISISINGAEATAISPLDEQGLGTWMSNGANYLTYSLKIDNVTVDTDIVVTIGKGTPIQNGVVVTVKDNVGGTAVPDGDSYYWNDGCDLHITPAESYEIESITVNGGEPITSGWKAHAPEEGASYTFTFTLPQSILEPTTVVVAFKLIETTQPDPEQPTDPETDPEGGSGNGQTTGDAE